MGSPEEGFSRGRSGSAKETGKGATGVGRVRDPKVPTRGWVLGIWHERKKTSVALRKQGGGPTKG